MASRTLATPIITTQPTSVDSKSGRYVNGGDTTVLEKRLGWWERINIEARQDDIDFLVTGQFVGRPDLIAHESWGQAGLAWLVLQYNNIVDLNEELVEGTMLTLPTQRRVVTSIVTKATGGVQ